MGGFKRAKDLPIPQNLQFEEPGFWAQSLKIMCLIRRFRKILAIFHKYVA